jgi:hypothetical protein
VASNAGTYLPARHSRSRTDTKCGARVCDNPLRPGGVPMIPFGPRDGRLAATLWIASRWSSTDESLPIAVDAVDVTFHARGQGKTSADSLFGECEETEAKSQQPRLRSERERCKPVQGRRRLNEHSAERAMPALIFSDAALPGREAQLPQHRGHTRENMRSPARLPIEQMP